MKVKRRTLTLQERICDLEAQIELLQAGLGAVSIESRPIVQRSLQRTVEPPVYRVASPPSQPLRWLSASSTEVFTKSRSRHLQPSPLSGIAGLSIGGWWSMSESPPSGLIATLIQVSVQHQHQYTHDPRPSEFYALLYDPNPDAGLHPALKNAIFLLACNRGPESLIALEPVFFRRTAYFLQQSLARADRLLDFIEASLMLSFFHIHKGRYLQAVSTISATLTFAVACGLHALRPPEWHPVASLSLLPQAVSRTEIRRRVRLWWILFTTNRFGSLAGSFDIDVDDQTVETVWEVPANSDDEILYHCSVSSLFIRGSRATYVYNDTGNAIRSKCTVLAERATRFGAMAGTVLNEDHVFWEQFEAIDHAIQRVTGSLPSVYEETRYEAGTTRVELQTTRMNHFIIFYHMLTCDATIGLHSQLARAGNAESRNACIEACQRVMPIVRHMIEYDMGYSASHYLQVVWVRMLGVFSAEYERNLAAGEREKAHSILPDLKALNEILKTQPII
ncbi:hypothetical protein BOTBODRAFT_182867 [Botryobasidium botryosum FD-172 SS1]|uniref:Transcription factor domain-containing protein n=1 Tax=Botryobasidium botryosum (strain FD-172 SS1) TaxID=930990 RepID=A0A067N0M8_BOTB1|nr:hypothetical protein BOTBODRAFT_182867 [Botryobasidium botryosum FD-172 SS1]